MKFFSFGPLPPPPRPPRRPPAPPLSRSQPRARRAPAPLPPSIVGQWREPGSRDTMEFLADGTLLERLAGGELIAGSYALAGGRLRIQLASVGEALTFSFRLTSDALELSDAEGQVTHYRRV